MTRRGSLSTVAAVVGFVLGVCLVLTLLHTNDLLETQSGLLEAQNEQSEEADVDRLRAEYQRVLLGCNTAGAVESDDPDLRHLCEEELQDLKRQLEAE